MQLKYLVILLSSIFAVSSALANDQQPTNKMVSVKAFIKQHPKKLAAGLSMLGIAALLATDKRDYVFDALVGFFGHMPLCAMDDHQLEGEPIDCYHPDFVRASSLIGFFVHCFGTVVLFNRLVDYAASKI
jgi:hypothetical protein